MPGAWCHRSHLLELEGQIWRHGGVRCQENEVPGRGERTAEENVCRSGHGQSDSQRPLHKKRLGPATKRQLAEELVREQGVPVSRACKLVSFPRSQFYYSSKRDDKELIEALQGLGLLLNTLPTASGSFSPTSEGRASPGTIRKYTESTSF